MRQGNPQKLSNFLNQQAATIALLTAQLATKEITMNSTTVTPATPEAAGQALQEAARNNWFLALPRNQQKKLEAKAHNRIYSTITPEKKKEIVGRRLTIKYTYTEVLRQVIEEEYTAYVQAPGARA